MEVAVQLYYVTLLYKVSVIPGYSKAWALKCRRYIEVIFRQLKFGSEQQEAL
jgi:hypothetical protein